MYAQSGSINIEKSQLFQMDVYLVISLTTFLIQKSLALNWLLHRTTATSMDSHVVVLVVSIYVNKHWVATVVMATEFPTVIEQCVKTMSAAKLVPWKVVLIHVSLFENTSCFYF